MADGTILVKVGQSLNIVGVPADAPLPPFIPGPVDPGYSPPWAQVPPGLAGNPRPSHPIALPGDPWWGGGGPVDPGYSPPWAQVPDKPPLPPGPVDPGYSPPWAQIPAGENPGNWVWGYSPQQGRWVWVRVPGEGEAGPK